MLETLPQIGEEIPVEWAKIRRKLAKFNYKIILTLKNSDLFVLKVEFQIPKNNCV